ncbi:hypothetical protein Tco_1221208 [Tanacetum coccineum]
MSTQQDIYAASSENRPPMLNKENYIPWSSCLLRYAKSRSNGKLIYNSIINGPYVRRMIPEPSDQNREVPVNESFHEQTDDELIEKELKQVEANDQAIPTILLGPHEDICAAVDSYETAQEIWLRVQQMMKSSDIGIQEKKNQKEVDDLRAERRAKTHDPLALMANSNNPFNYLVFHQDQPSSSTYMQQPLPNNNNYNLQPSFNQNYMQQPMPNLEDITDSTTAMNMALVLMAKAFKLNYSTPTNNNQIISSNLYNRQIAKPGMNMGQDRQMQMVRGNGGNPFRQYAGQNVGNQNGYNVVQSVGNQVVQNAVQNPVDWVILLGTAQLDQGEEMLLIFRLSLDLDEIEEVNANCILMANLQQALTLGTQIDKAPVYDSDGSVEVSSVEQDEGTVDQHPTTVEETHAYFESLYNNLTVEVEKHDPPTVYDSEETLQLAQESRLKMKQLNKEIKPANYTKINHLSRVFVSQTAKSREELYLSNTSKMANVSKPISIPNEEFSDDTTPSVARKFLNEVKSTIVTLQRVVKQKMTLDIHNWSSSVHQEIHKIVKDEIFPIVNQVDARLQNFKIQFLKEAAKFVRDFKSLAKEADESLAKHKALELEIERLLRAVVSQDIMSIVQSNSVIDTSNLQTELDRTKERFENCIIKKENEYAKLWNDWYKKCEECKYDKISYDKAYNDMQQKIERLQAQLGDQKGKSKDTPCVSNTLDPLSQKLENENVELEFQVRNYEKENAHLKTTYKNLFDSISVTRAQTKTIIDSLQDKLHDTIYENAKLRAQLFDKVSEQKDTTKGTSVNTQFCKQSILGKPPSSSGSKLYAVTPFPKSKGLPKIDKTHALSKPVTSNSVPTPQESKVVNNDKVIAPGMFRINPFKPSREEKYVPNKVRASVRTNPITVLQPHVITKKDVNSDSNGLSSKGLDNTAKTRRPQPRSNTKNDRVPSTSKSCCSKNKEVEVEEHPRNLLLSKNKKRMSSECNNIKLAIRNDKLEVVCAMCKQCLITTNHDVCVLNYVNDMNSRGKKQKANVSNTENQKKQKPKVMKPKKVGSNKRLASPKQSKPRSCLRWSPTRRLFDLKGKIIASSESESQSDCSNGDNACTSNPSEPTIKWFPNSTSFLGRLSKFVYGTVRFRNDHVAVILGFDDLEWGNILITVVYFVEGLGYNLFSIRKFCDGNKRFCNGNKRFCNGNKRFCTVVRCVEIVVRLLSSVEAQLVDTNTESEPEEAPSEDSTTPLSPDHPLTRTTPSRASFHRRTARMTVRAQPAMSPGHSARVAKAMTLSDLDFQGQQQAVPAANTTVGEPLGLGYEALRRRESGAVRDEIFLQRYRFRSLEWEQERVMVTFSAIWRPILALEEWAGQTDAQRATLWHAIYDIQKENHDLRM